MKDCLFFEKCFMGNNTDITEKNERFDFPGKNSESEIKKASFRRDAFCFGQRNPPHKGGGEFSVPFLFRHLFQDVRRFLCGDFL